MAVKNYPIGTHFKGPVKQGAGAVRLPADPGGISAIKTLTADESNGQNYVLTDATGFAVTLPAPTKGWSCKFTLGVIATTAYVLTAATAGQLQGSVNAGGIVVVCIAKDSISFAVTITNIGDTIEFWSDGVNIYVDGNVQETLAAAVA